LKIRPVGAELFHVGGRTDGRPERRTNMTKLKVALRNFANVSKNEPSHLETSGFPPGKRKPGVHHVREMRRPQKSLNKFLLSSIEFCPPGCL